MKDYALSVHELSVPISVGRFIHTVSRILITDLKHIRSATKTVGNTIDIVITVMLLLHVLVLVRK